MTEHKTKTVGATEVTFSIIEALKELDGSGVTELANYLDIPNSTVHKHLTTLHQLGYLKQVEGEYQLTLQFLKIGGYTRNQMKLYRTARDELEKLADETNTWANMVIEENGRGVVVDFARGDRAVELDLYTGKNIYLHATATGKSILAQMPRDEVEQIIDLHGLPAKTDSTITDEEELFNQLQTIRERGYSLDRQERIQGMKCVAAPIVVDDEVLGAISVSGTTTQMKRDRFEEEIPEIVTDAVNVIQINMSYSTSM